MDIRQLRKGSLIMISPRPNEQGFLLIEEIQKDNIIGKMLIPRQGYLFRIKYEEIIPVPLNAEWLEKAGFVLIDEQSALWQSPTAQISLIHTSTTHNTLVIAGQSIAHAPIAYVHQLQNGYTFLTGEEIDYGAGMVE